MSLGFNGIGILTPEINTSLGNLNELWGSHEGDYDVKFSGSNGYVWNYEDYPDGPDGTVYEPKWSGYCYSYLYEKIA